MARYNSTSLALAEKEAVQDCLSEVESYLSSEGGYWQNHDVWLSDTGKFAERGISIEGVKGSVVADFSSIQDRQLKSELKYYTLWSLSMGVISASTFTANYKPAVKDLGELLQEKDCVSGLAEAVVTEEELTEKGWSAFHKDAILWVLGDIGACHNEQSVNTCSRWLTGIFFESIIHIIENGNDI